MELIPWDVPADRVVLLDGHGRAFTRQDLERCLVARSTGLANAGALGMVTAVSLPKTERALS